MTMIQIGDASIDGRPILALIRENLRISEAIAAAPAVSGASAVYFSAVSVLLQWGVFLVRSEEETVISRSRPSALCSPLFGLLQVPPPLLTRMLLLHCGQVPPVDCAPILAGLTLFIDPIAFVVWLVDEVRHPLFFLRHERIVISDVCIMKNLSPQHSFVVPARVM
jgi:hypothetical protein